MKRIFNNLKLVNKFALISSLALAVISLMGMGIVQYITGEYNRELYNKTSIAMEYLAADLEAGLKEVATATDYLVDDDQIQTALSIYGQSEDSGERARSKRKVYDSLYSYFNSTSAITSLVIMLPDGMTIRMGISDQDFGNDAWDELGRLADAVGGGLVWEGGDHFENAVVCARQIRRKEYLKLDKLATLFVEVDLEKLAAKSYAASALTSRNTCLIFETNTGKLYYPFPFPEEMESSGYASVTDYEVLHSKSNVYFVTSGRLPYTGWRYIHFSDYEELFAHLNIAIKASLLLLAVSTLMVILTLYTVTSRVTFHFCVLEDKMKHFAAGYPEPLPTSYDYSYRRDEIGVLHRRFDQTVTEYGRLVDENYRKQLLLKDASIKNLEQQINPHFLYNVLDSIYLMAEAHKVPDIANMSHALAGLFRASISESSPTVPLRHELDYLDSYLQIQVIRFKNTLSFTSQCEEACMEIMIPKLSIQPLVENAIKHGIEDYSEKCHIILSVRTQEDGIRICVSNTGSRFSNDMEYRLLHPQQPPENAMSDHGIGLKNINERLQLIYGDGCRLHFCNSGGYAIVYFVVPVTKENNS